MNLGVGAGPHNIMLTHDDKRLVVTDYFLVEDMFPFASPGKVQFEGDHKVHVLKVTRHSLEVDTRFDLDFNTAFHDRPGAAARDRGQVVGRRGRGGGPVH